MSEAIRCAHVDDAVERLLAGVVPADEDARYRAHATECVSCEALLLRVEGLVDGPPSPPEPDDLARRRGFLAMEARLRTTPPRVGWRPVAIAAAAVVAALGIGLTVGSRGRTQPARIAATPETAVDVVRWSAPPGGSATYDLGHGTRVVLSEGAIARVTGVDGPRLELTLAQGLLVGQLEHGGAIERITIHAPRGRVEVVGTVFAVRAEREQDVVAVREGVVRVRTDRTDVPVHAGQALSIETLSLVDATPLEPMWSLIGGQAPEITASLSPETAAPRTAREARPQAAVAVTGRAPEAATTEDVAPAENPLAIKLRIAEGTGPAAADARFVVARMLEDDGNRAGAARQYELYLAGNHTPHAREALQALIRLNQRLGRADRVERYERELARRFPPPQN
jgi:hypothetical protein